MHSYSGSKASSRQSDTDATGERGEAKRNCVACCASCRAAPRASWGAPLASFSTLHKSKVEHHTRTRHKRQPNARSPRASALRGRLQPGQDAGSWELA